MILNNKNIFSSSNWLFWILSILIIRGLVLVFFLFQSYQLNPDRIISGIAIQQNDYYMFLGVVDNYFKTGVYELYEGSNKVFAGRLPGYSMPYFILRFIFPQEISIGILIIFQIVLSVISVYFLGLLSIKWFNSKIYFVPIVVLFSISTYTSIFDLFTLAESFSVSAVIFGLYFLTKAIQNHQAKYYLLSGFFVAWAIFLRPFLGLLIVFLPIVILYQQYSSKTKINFSLFRNSILLFILPFMIFESLWIGRNYIQFNKFIPLEISLSESYGNFGIYGKAALGIRKLISSYGGDTAEFRKGSDAWWFHHAQNKEIDQFEIPTWVLSIDGISEKSFIEIRELYQISISNSNNEIGVNANNDAELLAIQLAEQIKLNAPFRYYFLNNLIKLRRFIFTNGTYLLPLPQFSEMNVFQKMVKIFYYFFYFSVTLTGLLSLFISFKFDWIKNNLAIQVTASLLLSIIIAIIFFGDVVENRYFITTFPFLLAFGTLAIIKKLSNNRGKSFCFLVYKPKTN